MMRSFVLRLALPAFALLALGACATKGDIRNLQTDMLRMQHHQDSVLLEIQRQNRLLLDSIRQTMALTVDARGTTANQLRQFEQNLTRFGELVSQVMGTLSRIEQRLTALEQRPAAPAPGGARTGGGSAGEYYDTGVQMMAGGSFATARMAFQQLVQEFPDHERAPDAQFQIGETFYREQQWNDAYAAMEAVAERWPQAPRARAALFRAGAIAEERREVPRARGYYNRIVQNYAGTDEARQAQARLRALPAR
jgi:tol-pal system protein YbgF